MLSHIITMKWLAAIIRMILKNPYSMF